MGSPAGSLLDMPLDCHVMLLLFSMLTTQVTVMHNSMLLSPFSQQMSTAQPLSHALY